MVVIEPVQPVVVVVVIVVIGLLETMVEDGIGTLEIISEEIVLVTGTAEEVTGVLGIVTLEVEVVMGTLAVDGVSTCITISGVVEPEELVVTVVSVE